MFGSIKASVTDHIKSGLHTIFQPQNEQKGNKVIVYMSITGLPAHLGHTAAVASAINTLTAKNFEVMKVVISLAAPWYVQCKNEGKEPLSVEQRAYILNETIKYAAEKSMFKGVKVEYTKLEEELGDHPYVYWRLKEENKDKEVFFVCGSDLYPKTAKNFDHVIVIKRANIDSPTLRENADHYCINSDYLEYADLSSTQIRNRQKALEPEHIHAYFLKAFFGEAQDEKELANNSSNNHNNNLENQIEIKEHPKSILNESEITLYNTMRGSLQFKQKILADSMHGVQLNKETIEKITLPLRERYNKTSYKKFYGSMSICNGAYNLAGEVSSTPNEFSLRQTGVALNTTFMAYKHNLDQIFVPESDQSLFNLISNFVNKNEDSRTAFIACRSAEMISNIYHKFCVCLEKKDNLIKIAILDPQGDQDLDSETSVEISMITENYIIPIINTINQNNPSCELKIYNSKVKRETSSGCESFALQDGRNFLKDEQFFEDIEINGKLEKNHANLPETPLNLEVYEVSRLKPEYMIGTQSMTKIDQYIKENPVVSEQPLPGRSKTLCEYIAKYCRIVDGKVQNHYITYKSASYLEKAIVAAEISSEQDIYNLLMKTFKRE